MPLYQRVLLALAQSLTLTAVLIFLMALKVGVENSAIPIKLALGITFSLIVMAPFMRPRPHRWVRIASI